MHRLRRLLLPLVAAALALAAFTGTALAVPTTRVTLCHRVGGPNYVVITVSPEAVFGNGNGHAGNHPLDIIPAFTYTKGGREISFPGQNLTVDGIAILGNQCVRPLPPGDDRSGDPSGHEDPHGPADPTDPMIPEHHMMVCHWMGDGEYRDEIVTDEAAAHEHGEHPHDVIPAFDYALPSGMEHFDGRNVTDDGAELLDHGCTRPNPDDQPTPGQPHLRLVKSAVDLNGGTVAPGDTLRFSIVVTNDGSAPAAHALVTDAIPAGTSLVPGTLGVTPGDVEILAGHVVARVGAGASSTHGGTLAPGGSSTITFDATVDEGLVLGTVIVNVAQGTTVADDGTTPLTEDSNTIELPVDLLPPVPINMTVDPPADPTPGSDMPTVIDVTPKADLVDATACVTIEVAARNSMGTATTTCAEPMTVKRGELHESRLLVHVPRRAAGRCVMLVTSVAAAGHAAREHSTRVCVARSHPEAVTG